jgi:DnaJ-class molecular chaperone
MHPDKNKAENATQVFRTISKAYEVLSGNESKPLFDYYLDHPRVRLIVVNAVLLSL